MTDLVEFVRARLDEWEWWARESSRDAGQYTEGGEHWRWVDADTDEVVVPDPTAGEFMRGAGGGWVLSLRSAEKYTSHSVGPLSRPLPHFALSQVEELSPMVAGHIARHDPARILAEVEALRRIVDGHEQALQSGAYEWPSISDLTGYVGSALMWVVETLAAIWRDHADYDPAWAPEENKS